MTKFEWIIGIGSVLLSQALVSLANWLAGWDGAAGVVGYHAALLAAIVSPLLVIAFAYDWRD